MKLWTKILFIIFIILTLLWTGVYAFISIKGRTILVSKLEGLTHKKVNVDYFGLVPPFDLKIKNLDIPGLVKIDSLRISPSILWLLTGSIAFNTVEIIKPELFYERIALSPDVVGLSITPSPAVPKKEGFPRLIFKHIKVRDGRIVFVDRSTSEEAIKITITDLNFSISNLYIAPISVITNFSLEARIPWQNNPEQGKIKAEGWVNFLKRDMQATLKIEDIDGIALYPYYSKWVDLEKARIEKARLSLNSDIRGLNNDVAAQCRLELTDIIRKPRLPDEPEAKAERITDVVLGIFKALNQGRIVLDFTIRTKMDRPEFGFGDIKMALEDKLTKARGGKEEFKVQDALKLPVNLIEGTIKGATDLSKAVINGVVAIVSEIKKTAEGTFKKEK